MYFIFFQLKFQRWLFIHFIFFFWLKCILSIISFFSYFCLEFHNIIYLCFGRCRALYYVTELNMFVNFFGFLLMVIDVICSIYHESLYKISWESFKSSIFVLSRLQVGVVRYIVMKYILLVSIDILTQISNILKRWKN